MHNQKINRSLGLTSPLFLIALSCLLLNDFYFKFWFHNALTGKLSDVVGLIVLPIFLTVVFAKKPLAYLLSLILFLIWKSPLSEPFIDGWNSFNFYQIGRVVDYTDYFALLVLPLTYFHKTRSINLRINQTLDLRNLVFLVTAFSLVATAGTTGRFTGFEISASKKQVFKEINRLNFQNPELRTPTFFYKTVNPGPFNETEFKDIQFLPLKDSVNFSVHLPNNKAYPIVWYQFTDETNDWNESYCRIVLFAVSNIRGVKLYAKDLDGPKRRMIIEEFKTVILDRIPYKTKEKY